MRGASSMIIGEIGESRWTPSSETRHQIVRETRERRNDESFCISMHDEISGFYVTPFIIPRTRASLPAVPTLVRASLEGFAILWPCTHKRFVAGNYARDITFEWNVQCLCRARFNRSARTLDRCSLWCKKKKEGNFPLFIVRLDHLLFSFYT